MADKEKIDVKQLTVKVPVKWHSALVRIAGEEMAKSGEECSISELVVRSLNRSYDLEKKTGQKASND